jgi:hypothetical protein
MDESREAANVASSSSDGRRAQATKPAELLALPPYVGRANAADPMRALLARRGELLRRGHDACHRVDGAARLAGST